jgi:hypothetical protein
MSGVPAPLLRAWQRGGASSAYRLRGYELLEVLFLDSEHPTNAEGFEVTAVDQFVDCLHAQLQALRHLLRRQEYVSFGIHEGRSHQIRGKSTIKVEISMILTKEYNLALRSVIFA